MTQDEKLIYLNEIVKNNFKSEYKGPLILYKYRPFDEYTFEMLENDYIFLCPAEKEDDETECLTTTNLNEMLDPKTGNLSKKYLNKIVSLIKPSSTDKNYEIAKDKVFEIADKEGTNPIIFNKDFAIELKKMAPEGIDVGPIIKAIENIPEMLNKPEMSKTLEPAFKLAIDARKKIGICSLAETNNIDYMWKNYAQESSGYCIEYDLNDYELVKNILPVIYQDENDNYFSLKKQNDLNEIIIQYETVDGILSTRNLYIISVSDNHYFVDKKSFINKETLEEIIDIKLKILKIEKFKLLRIKFKK